MNKRLVRNAPVIPLLSSFNLSHHSDVCPNRRASLNNSDFPSFGFVCAAAAGYVIVGVFFPNDRRTLRCRRGVGGRVIMCTY